VLANTQGKTPSKIFFGNAKAGGLTYGRHTCVIGPPLSTATQVVSTQQQFSSPSTLNTSTSSLFYIQDVGCSIICPIGSGQGAIAPRLLDR
jgi:hypothetical protein